MVILYVQEYVGYQNEKHGHLEKLIQTESHKTLQHPVSTLLRPFDCTGHLCKQTPSGQEKMAPSVAFCYQNWIIRIKKDTYKNKRIWKESSMKEPAIWSDPTYSGHIKTNRIQRPDELCKYFLSCLIYCCCCCLFCNFAVNIFLHHFLFYSFKWCLKIVKLILWML